MRVDFFTIRNAPWPRCNDSSSHFIWNHESISNTREQQAWVRDNHEIGFRNMFGGIVALVRLF